MNKLRRVKSFAKSKGALQAVTPGMETMLVQPAPLLGAMPVRDGELYREGMKYTEGNVTEPESEEEKEEDDLIEQMQTRHNDTNMTADEIVRACNSTCQEVS